MGSELKACPFCGLAPSRAAKSYGTPIVCCGNAHCTLGASDADWYEIDDWNQRPIEDAAIARAEAAEQRAEAYRAFAAAVVRGVYPGDTGAVLANHIDTDLLPDALTRLHERLAEQRVEAQPAEVTDG